MKCLDSFFFLYWELVDAEAERSRSPWARSSLMCVFLHNSEKTRFKQSENWINISGIGRFDVHLNCLTEPLTIQYSSSASQGCLGGFFVCCIRFSLNKKFVLFSLCCESHTIMRIRFITHRWRLARCRIFTCSIFDILHDHGIGVFFHLVVHSLDDPDAIYLVIFVFFVLIQIQSGTNDVLHFFFWHFFLITIS